MSDLGNTSVFSATDASNNSATMPGWNGGFAPSTLDNAGRALQGAVTRQWNMTNPTVTSTGTGTAYVLTYGVAPAALYTGQTFRFIVNTVSTGAATLNINALGATSIKKAVAGSLVDVAAGDIAAAAVCEVYYNGTYFVLMETPYSLSTASTTEVLTGTDSAKAVTADALAALWEQGSDIASAGTISVGEGGYFNVTGTTTITDIDFATDKTGRRVWLKFAGALTLTHNSTTLILPGGASITTAAGDTAEFVSEGSDNVRCVSYTKASGKPVANPDALSTASGTAPSYAIRAWVNFDASSGTPTINGSGNVSSITDNGVGDYTINFTTALPNANYAVVGGTNSSGSSTSMASIAIHSSSATGSPTTKTTSAVRIGVGYVPGGTTNIDMSNISVMVIG